MFAGLFMGLGLLIAMLMPRSPEAVTCVWQQPRNLGPTELVLQSTSCSDGQERFVGCLPDPDGTLGHYRCGCMLGDTLTGESSYRSDRWLLAGEEETQEDILWIWNQFCPSQSM